MAFPGWHPTNDGLFDSTQVIDVDLPEPFIASVANGIDFEQLDLGFDIRLITTGNFTFTALTGTSGTTGEFGFDLDFAQLATYGEALIDSLELQTALELISETCPDTTVLISEESCPSVTVTGDYE